MEKIVYTLVINRGRDEGFEVHEFSKEEFIRHSSHLLTKPKRIFCGLGDFLEIGDYNNLLDSIFFEKEAVKFEVVLDRVNRKVSESGTIPSSFLKLAVYYPDFLLKGIPTTCASTIGRKSRLTPGARNLIKYLQDYPILVLSAMPYEIAIEFVRRVGLSDENLISTVYRVEKDAHGRSFYAGGIERFISGDRKSLEIEKRLASEELKETDVVYMGRGEAGVKTFHTVNSVAFNPSDSIIPVSKITVYGSSLESLLVLFNFDGELDRYLLSNKYEEFLPSLIVFSEKRNKSPKLVDLEREHRQLQNNIIGQRIEYEGESYNSVERDIEVEFGASAFDIKKIREEISKRMEHYQQNLEEFANKIYVMARERYLAMC
ncbi:MAG: hypothetical protein N2316_11095 [Spirochaetes bacterium]|nr:hypothetical protein [Spirochaetota bacterium]